MLCYQTMENQDADDRRGQLVTYAELEPSDAEEIKEQIIAQFDQYQSTYTVYLYCHQLESEHEFEVLITDYFTEEELYKLASEGD